MRRRGAGWLRGFYESGTNHQYNGTAPAVPDDDGDGSK